MITVVAKLRFQKGQEEEAEKALRDMIDYVRTEEPGTLRYVLHQAHKDPTEFLVFEQYEDPVALDKHSKSARFQSLFETLGPKLDGQPSIEIYKEIGAKW